MNREDGKYQGTIVNAYIAEDQWDEGQYVIKADVNLEGGGAVTCRQPLKDSEKEKRAGVLKMLELPWPIKAADVKGLAGKTIDVNLKTSPKGRQNAYFASMREDRVLSDDEINAAFDDGPVPF